MSKIFSLWKIIYYESYEEKMEAMIFQWGLHALKSALFSVNSGIFSHKKPNKKNLGFVHLSILTLIAIPTQRFDINKFCHSKHNFLEKKKKSLRMSVNTLFTYFACFSI